MSAQDLGSQARHRKSPLHLIGCVVHSPVGKADGAIFDAFASLVIRGGLLEQGVEQLRLHNRGINDGSRCGTGTLGFTFRLDVIISNFNAPTGPTTGRKRLAC